MICLLFTSIFIPQDPTLSSEKLTQIKSRR